MTEKKDKEKVIKEFVECGRCHTSNGKVGDICPVCQEKIEEPAEAIEKFFPEYLNKGSKGPPVALLQFLLLSTGQNPKIIVDGIYGEETAKGVEKLQEFLEIPIDGHFGSETRRVLATGVIDVNKIAASAFTGKTIAISPS